MPPCTPYASGSPHTKLRRISTYVYFLVFTALAALWTAAAGGAFASASIVFSSDNGPEDIHIGNAGHSGVGSAGPFRSSISSLRMVLSSSGRCMSSPEV